MAIDHKPGEVVAGRYRLETKVGRGGYGTVFHAHDLELDRPVAIKILRMSDFTDSRSRADNIRTRFRQEARAAARVRHPNIVTIFDVGATEDAEDLYIVMELLEGWSLGEEIATHGRMPLSRARVLFVPCLHGLAAAHEKGIVHKDLKPSNLILDQPGTSAESLQIIDFGVARLLDQDAQQTATGRMAGTPRYSAPEYIMGDDVTPAVDVYQMGLILAETLAGFPAIPSGLDARATVQRHLGGVLDLAEEVVDSPVGPVLARALAPEPEHRFPTAAMFADALDTIDVSEWEYDDEVEQPDFTPKRYTPSSTFTPSGDFTPSDSFTPLGSRPRPVSDEELAPTVVDLPSESLTSDEPADDVVAPPTGAAAPGAKNQLVWLAGLAMASLTALGAFYIYRSTGLDTQIGAKQGGMHAADPDREPVESLVSPEKNCVWRTPPCEIECTIDVETQSHDCPAIIHVALEPGYGRAQIDVPQPDHAVSVETVICKPGGWVFHFADSSTSNGGGGDAGTSEFNAELQVIRHDVSLFEADPPEGERILSSTSYPGLVRIEGCEERRFHFADQVVAVDGICSPTINDRMLRLDPPSDSEGEPDRTWYMGLNTTYLESERTGKGVKRATICIGPRYDEYPQMIRE